MYVRNGFDSNDSFNQPATAVEDPSIWKLKYERLDEQYNVMKSRNEELEDRLLNLVEKVEQEKLILSKEVDQLVGKLSQANVRISALQDDCVRYKKDCITAVNLLHCEPARYKHQEEVAVVFPKKESSKKTRVVRNVATFPPMAVYFPDDSDLQPDDPAPRSDEKQLPVLVTPNFTSEFVKKIKNDEQYSCVDLKRCPRCNTIQAAISRETQTVELQAPWPKIVGSSIWTNKDSFGAECI